MARAAAKKRKRPVVFKDGTELARRGSGEGWTRAVLGNATKRGEEGAKAAKPGEEEEDALFPVTIRVRNKYHAVTTRLAQVTHVGDSGAAAVAYAFTPACSSEWEEKTEVRSALQHCAHQPFIVASRECTAAKLLHPERSLENTLHYMDRHEREVVAEQLLSMAAMAKAARKR